MTRTRTSLFATIAVAALLVAACGEDDAESGEGQTNATNAPTEETSATDAPTEETTSSEAPVDEEPAEADPGGTEPGQDWDGIVAAANEEGAVVVYSGSPDSTNALVEAAFEATYPEIDAEIVRLNSSEIVPRVDTERSTGSEGADVLSNTLTPWLNQMADEGDLTEMVGPAYAAVLESTYAERPALARDRFFGSYTGGAWEIVWNTDLVDTPISGYADLVARADEFEGQVAMPDLYGDVVVEYYRNIQVGADGEGDPAESEILAGLAALEPRFFDSVVPLTNAVAAGEVKAGIYSVAPVWRALEAEGAPVTGTTDPEIPASANVYLAVTGYAKNPNAAQVFADFMFSPDGQTAAATGGYLTVLEDIEGSGGGPDAMAAPRPEMDDPEFIESFRVAWESLFR